MVSARSFERSYEAPRAIARNPKKVTLLRVLLISLVVQGQLTAVPSVHTAYDHVSIVLVNRVVGRVEVVQRLAFLTVNFGTPRFGLKLREAELTKKLAAPIALMRRKRDKLALDAKIRLKMHLNLIPINDLTSVDRIHI